LLLAPPSPGFAASVPQVQRPGVVEAIGRDTYILRNLADIARRQAKLNTDLPALVDEWASR
jgi:aarF domain-containing kinase